MSQKIALYHRTEYRYDRSIMLGPQTIRLRPAAHCRTPVISYSLRITPNQHFLNWQQDVSGNFQARVVVPDATDRFQVEVDLVADLVAINPFDFFVEQGFESVPFRYPASNQAELSPFLRTLTGEAQFVAWLAEIRRIFDQPGGMPSVPFFSKLTELVRDRVDYSIRMEPGVQTPEETLTRASGSCRDSAWLLVQTLRHLGLAARFVSGYLVQLAFDQKPVDGPVGPEKDFTDLHAWCEVYLPGAGWIGLDATSGLFAGEGHIPLACTPEPANAAPLSGAHEPCESTFTYEMQVSRIREKPSSALPYTGAVWEQLDALGENVDQELRRLGVHLTMGGEPTFVFAKDPDGDEWNVRALGSAKRALGARLLYRLAGRFAPGGLLFHGQGKWYPGEELPRWALGVYYRNDGASVWERSELLAREGGFETPEVSAFRTARGARTIDDAHELILEIARRLGLGDYFVKSARNPIAGEIGGGSFPGVPPVRGFVLPLRWWNERSVWTSARWDEIGEPVVLIAGDSPMGYRLPLGNLGPETFPGEHGNYEPSTFETPPALQKPSDYRTAPISGADFETIARRDRITPEAFSLHTALCVELRDGALFVFLPPQNALENWLGLVGAIENAVAAKGFQVFFEGYPPPFDLRMRTLLVTPDPGVIEVNIPPCDTWGELRDLILVLGEEARREMLVAEKYQLDGRPGGSGGGNHITLGGPVPAESPFLLKPGLLRSFVTYFQHHPSLSYLFSGFFIGPTSQAPRIDEGRHESLYELEIAFQKMPLDGSLPWLCDRLLRHHLTDLTGNTHRAEICIDKLYPPDRLAGRLGLVELRAFEMLPHPRMNLAVMLLVRAIAARLLREDYFFPFRRFGTDLHDRFMLPFYLEKDLDEVRTDLAEFGFVFPPEFFEPILEFRFPVFGSVNIESTMLEIRAALEPWHVLGEESVAGNTSRMVDSALERVQITARGFDPRKRVVLCNGFRVPLRPTGLPGEFVAGIRFKAWHLTHTLHPNLKVHAPLVFDLVDPGLGRSLGGCTYHVTHPGGRAYEKRPVNAAEAEARRQPRFWPHGHTPGKVPPAPEVLNHEFPHTLDLRLVDP